MSSIFYCYLFDISFLRLLFSHFLSSPLFLSVVTFLPLVTEFRRVFPYGPIYVVPYLRKRLNMKIPIPNTNLEIRIVL